MSKPAGNCAGCGAPIQFQWSSAVQTVCPFCRSILVRHDLNLERVGRVADLPEDISPIQLGTEGFYGGKSFVAVGRIVYDYAEGSWNEWHLGFNDGSSGWLSDAQLEYALSHFVETKFPLAQWNQVHRGQRFRWDDTLYEVTTITKARYRGVEGELPFEY